jgi:hypothetical protein
MAPVESGTNWAAELATKPWTPLRQAHPNAVLIRGHLFRIGQDAYVLVSERDSELRVNQPGAPFVIALLWAESEGAAVRAALRDVTADACVSDNVPPSLLLPEGTARTYSELRKLGRKGTFGRVLEHADYWVDGAGEGHFANKIIQVGKISYYFRSPEDIAEEFTFAIRVGL